MAPRRASPEPHLVTLQRASADPSARARSGSHSSSSSSSSDGSGDEDTYVVESILRRRVAADGEYEYLVKWEGYEGDEATTWEPEEVSKGGKTSPRSSR